MDAQSQARARLLLERALALPVDERAAFVVREAGGDPELARELSELLCPREGAEAPRPSVAGYRLVRELGRGGMGVVWLAEQENPRRLVALKLLRLDSLASADGERFRQEAEILARLHHPGIAHVYATGVTATELGARPWIAMEYVHGRTLKEHVDAHVPGLRGRVELFLQLCDALQHAHENGVVHRDLKPSNVLVDADGRVRVLDFGVARLCGGTGAGPHTRSGQVVGTLAYASPEQAAGRAQEVSAATDVYALGVMLHELLTGELPYPIDESRIVEAVQAICDEDPRRLRGRRRDAPADLELVLLKALEKEPARRYADAGELGADLRRFLADQPVRAHAPTKLYQARKLVRRHRALVLGTGAVIAALALAVAVLLVSRQNDRRQYARLRAMLDRMAQEVFRLVPEVGFAQDHRGALEALDARLAEELEIVPGDRALRGYRARSLYELGALDQLAGDLEAARRHFEGARILRTELAREDRGDVDSRTHLSQIYARLGELARLGGEETEVEAWFRRAFELDQALVRERPGDGELVEDLGWSLERLADLALRRGDRDEAERLARWRLADAERLVTAEPGHWKYLYNAAMAHGFLAHLAPLDSEARFGHARAQHELARRLIALQPRRAVFLRLLAGANHALSELERRAGRMERALSHGEGALVLALLLLAQDPVSLDHADFLRATCTSMVGAQLALGWREQAHETVERLRSTATIAADGLPSGLLLQAAAEHLAMRLCETRACLEEPRERALQCYTVLLAPGDVPRPVLEWVTNTLRDDPLMAAELCARLQQSRADASGALEGLADAPPPGPPPLDPDAAEER